MLPRIGGHRSILYDIENRVIGITYPGGATNSFAYNGEDLRTQKVDSTGTQNYVTDGSSPGSELLKDGNAVYTPGVSEHRGSTSKFYHGDALGSTRGITDSSQTVTGTLTLDGFGNPVASTGSSSNPYMYAATSGYRNDGDAGLTHVGARYYDAQVGRFISRDNCLNQKPCLYCEHDPINYADPAGHAPITNSPKYRRPQGPPLNPNWGDGDQYSNTVIAIGLVLIVAGGALILFAPVALVGILGGLGIFYLEVGLPVLGGGLLCKAICQIAIKLKPSQ